jgi:hypothetical protein
VNHGQDLPTFSYTFLIIIAKNSWTKWKEHAEMYLGNCRGSLWVKLFPTMALPFRCVSNQFWRLSGVVRQ